MKVVIFILSEEFMKKFAKISAVLFSLFLVFSFLGCKDDSDDDEPVKEVDVPVATKEDINNIISKFS